MTKRNSPPVDAADDEFDPTRSEGNDSRSDDNAIERELPLAFAHVPSDAEISQKVTQFFGGTEISDALRASIAEEAEEVAHSTRKILLEHMRIGGSFYHIRTRVEAQYVSAFGDTTQIRKRAAQVVYDFLEATFRKKRDSVRLYMRCYERFSTNSGAVEMLSISDMQLLVNKSDEVVEKVLDAKREKPDMGKRELKQIIDEYEQRLLEKDSALEIATSQLSDIYGRLDDAKNENERLAEEAKRLNLDVQADREKLKKTLVDLASAEQTASGLQSTIADLERERDTKVRELKEAHEKVTIKEVQVEVTPEHLRDLEAAAETRFAELKRVKTECEAAQQRLDELNELKKKQEAEIEQKEAVEKRVAGLVERFGSFVQEYHSVQLLVTADGSIGRFKGLLTGLADLTGKFHGELQAAVRVA
jgi:chromosome segregation ATPase